MSSKGFINHAVMLNKNTLLTKLMHCASGRTLRGNVQTESPSNGNQSCGQMRVYFLVFH